jgi:hypothetical protein
MTTDPSRSDVPRIPENDQPGMEIDGRGKEDLLRDLQHPIVNMWAPLAVILLVLLAAIYLSRDNTETSNLQTGRAVAQAQDVNSSR